MGEIVDHAAEYATVERLAEMLTTAREDYKATQAYALFTAIVCWVMQRTRTPDEIMDHSAQQARTVGERLRAQNIGGPPWNYPAVPQVTAFDFFVYLRNACAHGDARCILPINEGGILRGYAFRSLRPHVIDEVRLQRRDMIRLGTELASIYCAAMREVPGEAGLAERANAILDIEAAA